MIHIISIDFLSLNILSILHYNIKIFFKKHDLKGYLDSHHTDVK